MARKGQEVAYLQLRYKLPEEENSQLLSLVTENRVTSFTRATDDFQFAAAVAAFGMKLRHSPFNKKLGFSDIHRLAAEAAGNNPDGHRREFLELVDKAERLGEE